MVNENENGNRNQNRNRNRNYNYKKQKIIIKKNNEYEANDSKSKSKPKSKPKPKLNVYDLCRLVEKYMLKKCNENSVDPGLLYEELHYQLPANWVNGLRTIIRERIKDDYDICSSVTASSDSDQSEISSTRGLPSLRK